MKEENSFNNKEETVKAAEESKTADVRVYPPSESVESYRNTKSLTDDGLVDSDVKIEIANAVTKEVSKTKDHITANFVTILGIFASFITFLGLEIQILRNICDYWRLIGFSFFILTAIIIFVFSIYIFIDNSTKGIGKIIGMCSIIFILFVGIFYSFSRSEDEYVCKLTHLNDRFEEINLQYSKKNNKEIEELKSKIRALELQAEKK